MIEMVFVFGKEDRGERDAVSLLFERKWCMLLESEINKLCSKQFE